jgi:exopolysaccharide biosynthesis polyprenyl glycosylphosphotransferase
MLHVTHIKRRKYFVLLDILVVIASCAIAIQVRRGFDLPFFSGRLDHPSFNFDNFAIPGFILGLSYAASLYILGVYDSWATPSILDWFQRLLVPNFIMVAGAFTFLYVQQSFNFPRSLLITLFIINFGLSLVWRLWYFRRMAKEVSDIAVVGNTSDAIRFLKECQLPPFKHRVVVKAMFTSQAIQTKSHEANIPVLHIDQLPQYAAEHPLVAIIVVPSDHNQQNLFSQVFRAAKTGTGVYALPSHYEILFGRLKYFTFNDLPLLELKLDPPSEAYSIIKRGLDVTLAAVMMIMFLPVFVVTALAIKMSSKGPILYSQDRIGAGGRTFKIYKFRSMINNAESTTGPVLATVNDPRVTAFGKFMRKTRIDELPQLINIIKGDMSFVGPRPERPKFVANFENSVPWYRERSRIRPGVTGLAQIRGHYSSSAETKLKYDLAYLTNQGLLLDLQILARTIKTVLTKSGQ